MRGADLERPFPGVRVPAGSIASDLDHIRTFAVTLTPPRFFSGPTAALMWGCPLPAQYSVASQSFSTTTSGPTDPSLPDIDVSTIWPRRAPAGRGLTGHAVRDDRVRVVERHGLPVSDPAATFCSLAASLSLDDLVAAGDHLVLTPRSRHTLDDRPHIPIIELADAVSRFTGRGARRARSAIALVRDGAESRMETQLRLLLTRAGLPEPALNIDLYDGGRRWLGRADLSYPDYGVLVEYDGDHHRTDPTQYDRDITRSERFTDAGWKHLRVRKHGLHSAASKTVCRVERALASRGWVKPA